MKVLLIDPPYTIFTGYVSRYFPVGLCYIGEVLRRNGHDVVVYEADRERKKDEGDLNFSEGYQRLENYIRQINSDNHFIWKRIAEVVHDFNPSVIGITALTMKFGTVVKTAEICKKAKLEAKVIVGGAHANDWPDICLQSPYIDLCVSGEVEDTILTVLDAIDNGTSNYHDIAGVSFRNGKDVQLGKGSHYISDLDRYPYPGRDLLLNNSQYTSEDMGVIMTSRGCPYRCSFCSHIPRVRYRTLDNVIDEIEHVKEKYRTRQFAIKDDSFSVSKKRTKQFCEMLIKRNLNIDWDCTTRVNLIDEELLNIMQKAGCNTIKVGIETGSERILKEINKGITFKQVRTAAEMFNKNGIFWSAYFMYGLPMEKRSDMLKTLEFMKELDPPYAGLGLYAPMPNTQLWNKGLELGLIDSTVDINHFFETNPKDYFFKDYRKRVVGMEYEEFVELAKYLMKEFNKHNTHWKKMIRRGWSRKKAYMKDPGLMIGDIKKAINWLIN